VGWSTRARWSRRWGAGVKGRAPAVGAGVEMVRWPEGASRRAELAEQGVPRLLLVGQGVTPPPLAPDEDWIRLPADERDVWARLQRLELLRQRRGRRPRLTESGVLDYAGHKVALTLDQRTLLGPLVERFGQVVGWDDLVDALWPEGGGTVEQAIEACGHLRVRIAPTGLSLHAIGHRGLLLDHPVPEPG